MKILGYTDKLSVAPGEAIEFKISSTAASYRAAIVELQHGDLDPNGPGFKAVRVTSSVTGEYPGREQDLYPGSYAVVDAARSLPWAHDLTVTAWLQVTASALHDQGIVTQWSNTSHSGWGLWVTPDGDLAFRRGDGVRTERVRTDQPIPIDQWHFVAAVFDAEAQSIRLHQVPESAWSSVRPIVRSDSAMARQIVAPAPPPWLVGASHLLTPDSEYRASGHFNGKIEDPRIYGRALTLSEIEAIRTRDEDITDLIARWDFSVEMNSDLVLDASGHGFHGRTINTPMRAVTGRKWTGEETDHRNRPSQYAAIHFHDDDLDDARWDTDFTLTIPPTWKSGVYAAELKTDGFEDYVPFVVRPRAGHEAKVAVLLPTLSYRAYANEHMTGNLSVDEVAGYGTSYEQAAWRYITSKRLHSLYDEHTDGSGVCYSSRLRPMLNFRPRYNKPGLRFRHPHNLSCDLYLIDWLNHGQHRYDVITDDDLHAFGLALLRPYRTIITGTHPEYWTWEMLQSVRAYLDAGGRIMYLGGNGFYWVSSVDEDRPHIMEVRRGHAGSRRWSSAPGEEHHSTTGELGGLWRHRGLPPQATVGIGLAGLLSYFDTSEGGTNAYPYVRTESSNDDRVGFIFEGIDEEVIGDCGLHLGAAAGWEIDRADTSLGTPGHALVVATSTPGPIYQRVVEEMKNGGEASDEQRRKVRADVVFYEGPNGGAVFSVGSISWCGSLSHNGYDNSVSRMTSNVLSRFASDTPFPSPPDS